MESLNLTLEKLESPERCPHDREEKTAKPAEPAFKQVGELVAALSQLMEEMKEQSAQYKGLPARQAEQIENLQRQVQGKVATKPAAKVSVASTEICTSGKPFSIDGEVSGFERPTSIPSSTTTCPGVQVLVDATGTFAAGASKPLPTPTAAGTQFAQLGRHPAPWIGRLLLRVAWHVNG